jgi:hypothetical protein
VTTTHESTRLIAKCIMGSYLAIKLVIRTLIMVYVWISFVYNFANVWCERIHFILSVVRTQDNRLRRFLRGACIIFKRTRIILQSIFGFHAKAKRLLGSVLAIYTKTMFTFRYVSVLLVPTAFVSERAVALYRNIIDVYQRVSRLCSRNIMIIDLIWALYLPISIVLEIVSTLYIKTGTLLEVYMSPDLQA